MRRFGSIAPSVAAIYAFCLAAGWNAFVSPALADPTDSDQLAAINQRLSQLTTDDAPVEFKALPVNSAPQLRPGSKPAAVQQTGVSTQAALSRIIKFAERFRKIDHVMHFQVHGIDANFWGILNHGRGISIRFARAF